MVLLNFIQYTGSTLFCQVVLRKLLLHIDSAWYGVTFTRNSRCRHRMLVSVYHTVEIAVLQFGYIKGCATCRPSAGVGAVLQRFVSSHDGPFLVGPLWTPAHSMTQVFILMLNSIFNIRDIKLHRIYCCCISPKLVTVARHSRRG